MLSPHRLAAVVLLAPTFTFANPNPHERELAGFSFNELFARWDCSGTACGTDGQFCCTAGTSCTTNAANIAGCANAPATQAAAGGAGGSWQYYTSTWVETGLVTRTSIWSSYIGGAAATGIACNYALNESPCGSICCASNQYCFSKEQSQCAANGGGGSSGAGAATYVNPGATAGAPIRPTSSGQLTVTATRGPTTTVPFMEPVATGANVTVTGMEDGGGGGLSGGAIAGIVIGVLAGLALLALLCFCCCIKGLLDGCLACFGLGGRKKRRRTEIDEYERYSHHSGGGGGRTWYGAARPPARVDRRDDRKSSNGKNLLGLGAGLAALWAVLGLKRQRDNRKNNEKYSEYSYSSDYYTSASSASSDDRRTRGTRYSRR